MRRTLRVVSLVVAVAAFSAQALAQGETTSAIVGQVADVTGAVVPGATVTITNRDTGMKRSVRTDDAGRFSFPQLKPGRYSVRVETQGFEFQQNDGVFSGLGQKQTVNFTLRVARSSETVEVNGERPIINPENAQLLLGSAGFSTNSWTTKLSSNETIPQRLGSLTLYRPIVAIG